MANLQTVRISEQCWCTACLEHCLFQAQQKLRWKIWHPTSNSLENDLRQPNHSLKFLYLSYPSYPFDSTSFHFQHLEVSAYARLRLSEKWVKRTAKHSKALHTPSEVGAQSSESKAHQESSATSTLRKKMQKTTNRPRSYPNQSQSQSQ